MDEEKRRKRSVQSDKKVGPKKTTKKKKITKGDRTTRLVKKFAKNRKIKETKDQQEIKYEYEDKEDNQYLTYFSPEYNMAVYSAAVVEIKPGGSQHDRGGWSTPEYDVPFDGHPEDEDYQIINDFDRGHLFTFSYSKDEAQAKSTMRHTNAVPQDAVFNRGVWKEAEMHLMKQFIFKCNIEVDQTSVVITGAVPGYFGEDPNEGDILKIGKTPNNQKSSEPFPEQQFRPPKKDALTNKRLTVPTHMWTLFVCLNTRTNIAVDQTSYIGLNYRTGIIKWYTNYLEFYSTLAKLYQYQPQLLMQVNTIESQLQHITSSGSGLKHKKSCHRNEILVRDEMACKEIASPRDSIAMGKFMAEREVKFWNLLNIHHLRKNNEKHRLNYLLAMYGISFKIQENDIVLKDEVTLIGSESHHGDVGDVGGVGDVGDVGDAGDAGDDRRKRSIQSDQNITLHTLKIIDEDSDSDFNLSECKIVERYDGQIKETHVYDFETNTLVEDRRTGSSSELSAAFMDNGMEVESTKVMTKVKEINIVLTPKN
eukprot:GFUD01099048.1.p1 GENE.GFUD01099048.1~~GFUD01099048.1.p1  ORF type:complete len:620 (+),score=137.32 GFUD01099048.1:255-1862(+)